MTTAVALAEQAEGHFVRLRVPIFAKNKWQEWIRSKKLTWDGHSGDFFFTKFSSFVTKIHVFRQNSGILAIFSDFVEKCEKVVQN